MKKCILMLVVFMVVLIISMLTENSTAVTMSEDVMAVNDTKDVLFNIKD